MAVNKTWCGAGFRITTYCGFLPLSCLFGNWIQSLLSSGSTSSLVVLALNRQPQQKNVSILLILSRCFIISPQLMVLDCCYILCIISTHLYIIEKRKTDSTGGRRVTFSSPIYYIWKVKENVLSFLSPKKQKPLKEEDERTAMACVKGRERDQQTTTGRNGAGEDRQGFLKFFVHFLF